MRRFLGVKWDLGLFSNPYIPEDIDAEALTTEHIPLTLEAAQKSIVLLENRNNTLPLHAQNCGKIALIGPFSDILNYGDYSGQFGQYPVAHSSTIREGIVQILGKDVASTDLLTAWGANTWVSNLQYPIPGTSNLPTASHALPENPPSTRVQLSTDLSQFSREHRSWQHLYPERVLLRRVERMYSLGLEYMALICR